jgi:hypothetical protein
LQGQGGIFDFKIPEVGREPKKVGNYYSKGMEERIATQESVYKDSDFDTYQILLENFVNFNTKKGTWLFHARIGIIHPH